MNCSNFNGDIGPCNIEKNIPSIEMAGDCVGLDLTIPIDVSQMSVYSVSVMPTRNLYTAELGFDRISVLNTYVVNEYGDNEELEITFKLKSKRMPKIIPGKIQVQ